VLFNGDIEIQDITLPEYIDAEITLHPVQLASDDSLLQAVSFDSATGSFSVPGRTAAVFVSPQTQSPTEPPKRKRSGAITGPVAGLLLLLLMVAGSFRQHRNQRQ
jgi:hypothetical protein